MVEAPFQTLLVAAVGAAPLLASGLGAAGGAAITLSAVTVPTDPEHGVALAAVANPLTENNLAMTRHPRRQVGLDNGDRSWQGRSIPMDGYLMKVANRGPRRYKRRGPVLAPTFDDD
jgi:hypothetical protein